MRRQRLILWLVGALLSVLAISPASATARIAWRVENPFRFFVDPADSEVHRATYRALGPEERQSPVLAAEQALERRVDDGWASTMYRKTCWDRTRNSFRCPAYEDYINPTAHTVVMEIEGIEDGPMLSCTWLTAPHGGDSLRGSAVTQPCNQRFSLDVPYPNGAKVSVEIGGRVVAEEDVKVRDVLIAGLGDSFASGEGNPDIPVRFSRERAADYGSPSEPYLRGYPARVGNWQQIGDRAFIGENARWLDQACHRSLYSHQLRAALQLAVEDPHRAVTYVGVSCSGAEVTFGLFLRYKGNEWVPNPPALSQISAVAEAQCGQKSAEALDLPEAYHIKGMIPELKGGLVLRKCARDHARKIDLIFLSIGGNDIGFSRLLANTVLSNESLLRMLGGWIGEVHGQAEASQQLSRLDARYKSLNRAFHNLLYVPWNESDRIVLTGYPGLALEGDGSETCKDGRAGLEVVSDFRLSGRKAREGTWIADKLHRAMRGSAERYGWSFAETHRRKFIDRSICAGSTRDGGSVADDLRLPRWVDGKWVPYNPADFKAYTPRQRWFRTPNDAFMTGNFHVEASLLQKVMKFDTLASFQLLLAATYSGAFHPTAEGQAAIADAVADKARTVLKRYGQGVDPEPVLDEPGPAPLVPEPDVALPDVTSPIAPDAPVSSGTGEAVPAAGGVAAPVGAAEAPRYGPAEPQTLTQGSTGSFSSMQQAAPKASGTPPPQEDDGYPGTSVGPDDGSRIVVPAAP